MKKKCSFWVLSVFLVLGLTAFALRANGNGNYKQLPYSGQNFIAYGLVPYAAGRCYLLAPVQESVVDAYKELEKTCPGRTFIYLEMGWKGGGRFAPHRTHKEGRSADFLSPMKSINNGEPLNLPLRITNRWGYDIRLSAKGEYKTMVLDEKALILHLAALEDKARQRGWRIERVILDQNLVALLAKHPEYKRIANIPFMKGKAWFPHDGHYHVDFVPVSPST